MLQERQEWHAWVQAGCPDPKLPYRKYDGHDWLVAYLLDHFKLTEHGSSVGGAWPTEAGKEALAYLASLEDAADAIQGLVDLLENEETHRDRPA